MSRQARFSNQAILATSSHRPWVMPSGAWQYYQEWNDAIFLHWKVERDELSRFVPSALEIDSFEGQYWVSLVAFTMENIRMRNLPAFPPVSTFHEINIRTYVRTGEKTGVYFLSIEGGKRISCSIAKRLSELPYRFSEITRSFGEYRSNNPVYSDHLHIEYSVSAAVPEKSALDRWLTERYALFQDSGEAINQYEIHHVEWPLNDIDVPVLKVDYPGFHKLINGSPDKVHYSTGVQVVAWGKQRLPASVYV